MVSNGDAVDAALSGVRRSSWKRKSSRRSKCPPAPPQEGGTGITSEPLLQAQRAAVGLRMPRGHPHCPCLGVAPVCCLMRAMVQELIMYLTVYLFLKYSEAPTAGQMGWQWSALVPKVRSF